MLTVSRLRLGDQRDPHTLAPPAPAAVFTVLCAAWLAAVAGATILGLIGVSTAALPALGWAAFLALIIAVAVRVWLPAVVTCLSCGAPWGQPHAASCQFGAVRRG